MTIIVLFYSCMLYRFLLLLRKPMPILYVKRGTKTNNFFSYILFVTSSFIHRILADHAVFIIEPNNTLTGYETVIQCHIPHTSSTKSVVATIKRSSEWCKNTAINTVIGRTHARATRKSRYKRSPSAVTYNYPLTTNLSNLMKLHPSSTHYIYRLLLDHGSCYDAVEYTCEYVIGSQEKRELKAVLTLYDQNPLVNITTEGACTEENELCYSCGFKEESDKMFSVSKGTTVKMSCNAWVNFPIENDKNKSQPTNKFKWYIRRKGEKIVEIDINQFTNSNPRHQEGTKRINNKCWCSEPEFQTSTFWIDIGQTEAIEVFCILEFEWNNRSEKHRAAVTLCAKSSTYIIAIVMSVFGVCIVLCIITVLRFVCIRSQFEQHRLALPSIKRGRSVIQVYTPPPETPAAKEWHDSICSVHPPLRAEDPDPESNALMVEEPSYSRIPVLAHSSNVIGTVPLVAKSANVIGKQSDSSKSRLLNVYSTPNTLAPPHRKDSDKTSSTQITNTLRKVGVGTHLKEADLKQRWKNVAKTTSYKEPVTHQGVLTDKAKDVLNDRLVKIEADKTDTDAPKFPRGRRLSVEQKVDLAKAVLTEREKSRMLEEVLYQTIEDNETIEPTYEEINDDEVMPLIFHRRPEPPPSPGFGLTPDEDTPETKPSIHKSLKL